MNNNFLNNQHRDSNSENGPSMLNFSNLQAEQNSEEEVPLEISDYENSWDVKYMDDTIQNANVNISK